MPNPASQVAFSSVAANLLNTAANHIAPKLGLNDQQKLETLQNLAQAGFQVLNHLNSKEGAGFEPASTKRGQGSAPKLISKQKLPELLNLAKKAGLSEALVNGLKPEHQKPVQILIGLASSLLAAKSQASTQSLIQSRSTSLQATNPTHASFSYLLLNTVSFLAQLAHDPSIRQTPKGRQAIAILSQIARIAGGAKGGDIQRGFSTISSLKGGSKNTARGKSQVDKGAAAASAVKFGLAFANCYAKPTPGSFFAAVKAANQFKRAVGIKK